MSEKIGDLRVRGFNHPDSIGAKVWEVEQLSLADGKYSRPGTLYWARLSVGNEPFTSLADAEAFIAGNSQEMAG
jgi:hypothetical protein